MTSETPPARPDDRRAEGDGAEICLTINMRGISRATLEAAVRIAERMNTGLLGLFVDDVQLQQVADLPFTTEVIRSTGEERNLYAEHLRHRSRQLAASIQSLFQECARARHVECRFEVRQKRESVKVLMGQGRGLMVPGNPRRGGLPIRPVQASRVKVLFDGSDQALRALDLVQGLIDNGQCRELYLVNMGALNTRVLSDMTGRGVRVYLLNVHRDEPSIVRQLVDGPEADLVIVPRGMAEGISDPVLHQAVENSVSGATLLVA